MPAALAALSSDCTRPAPPPAASIGSRPKNLRLPLTSAGQKAALPCPTTATSNGSATGCSQQLREGAHVGQRVDRRDRIGDRRDRVLAQHPRRAQLELAAQSRRWNGVVGSAAERLLD